MTPEGVVVPGMNENDSMTQRIEVLRCFLEEKLGT